MKDFRSDKDKSSNSALPFDISGDKDSLEELLENSPESQAYFDDLEEISSMLKEGYQRDPILFLTHKQKEAIRAEIPTANRQREEHSRIRQLWGSIGIAACATVALVTALKFLPNHSAKAPLVSSPVSTSGPQAAEFASSQLYANLDNLYANLTVSELENADEAELETFSELVYPASWQPSQPESGDPLEERRYWNEMDTDYENYNPTDYMEG